MVSKIALFILALFTVGCGTFSVVRPADTLKEKQTELSGGLTLNGFNLLGVGKIDHGVTDWLEVGGQYEFYSWFVGTRAGLLSTNKHGFALALGLQAGETVRMEDIDFNAKGPSTFTLAPSLTLGRRWDWFEPYLGAKYFYFPSEPSDFIFTIKLGLRFHTSERGFLFIEGGTTTHRTIGFIDTTLGEGALGLGVIL